jgi:asparagine synthase (glutamine-hydrolysing)
MSALWAFTGPPDHALARRMGDALAHRAAGARPIVDAAPRVTIAVAARDARLGGLATDDTADLAVAFAGRLPIGTGIDDVAHAVEIAGVDAIPELPGEWILAFRTADRLVVARDAAGVRTAYWGVHGGRVLVAVEPKGVVVAPGFPRRLHPPSLAQFLAFSFVPGERTALADLFELPAGHRLDVDLTTGSTRLVRWFRHEEIDATDGPPEAWVAPTRAAIDRAVAARLPPGEPVSTFLSGGLDSSLVTAAATLTRRERGEPPPISWSLHFGTSYPNELEYAADVAERVGTDHRVVEVSGRSVANDLRRMVWHLDEPIGDPVTAGNFVLAEHAARESAWVLNGEGGDPLFGGPKNLPMLLAHWYPTGADPRFREAQYLATWRRAGEEIGALLHPDLLAEIDLERDLDGVVPPYFSADRPKYFLNKLMVANMRLKGAHLILPKVDRMLGAHGVVPLSPLFDPDVLRLSLEMPPTAKLRFGVEKWVLKQAYADALPRAVVDRPKSGMRVPVRWWFQGDLKRVARDLLSPRAVRNAGVFRPDRVREILRYRTGRDGLRLWMLVTFELWRRLVVEGEPL